MANKIRFYQTIDSKSIFWTIIVVSLISLLIYISNSYSPILDSFKLSKYDEETVGRLISTDEQVIFHQTRMGSTPSIDNIKVEFTYQVGENTFMNKEIVNGTIDNISNLRRIMNSSGKIIKIKYQSKNPSKSMINLLSD